MYLYRYILYTCQIDDINYFIICLMRMGYERKENQ